MGGFNVSLLSVWGLGSAEGVMFTRVVCTTPVVRREWEWPDWEKDGY